MASEDCVSWSCEWSALRTAGKREDEGDDADVEGADVEATGGSCVGGLRGGQYPLSYHLESMMINVSIDVEFGK